MILVVYANSDTDCTEKLSNLTYEKASKGYRVDQAKLEKYHKFHWVHSERMYSEDIQDKVLLAESVRIYIRKSEPVELFETFFSNNMKKYIIDVCKENDFDLRFDDLNTFIGIIMIRSFNNRNSKRDYWSSNPFLCLVMLHCLCDICSEA